jgi:hypothetical protein
MSAKHSWRVGFALALCVIAGFLLNEFLRNSAQIKRLPDGSTLRIAAVSYGTNHSYSISDLNRWQQLLSDHLPQSWRVRLNLLGGGGSVSSHADPGDPPYLAVFTIRKPPAANSAMADLKMTLSDDHGVICDTSDPGSSCSISGTYLVCWVAMKIPPHAERLLLKFSAPAADGKSSEEVATFSVRNPAVKPPEAAASR